jgi:integrase
MIGLRDIRDLGPNQILWDSGKGAVAGFGARRRSSEAITYIVKYRVKDDGRARWLVLGRHGVLTPDEARDKAKAILGQVVDGADPAAIRDARRDADTVADLCDRYIEDMETGRLLTRRRGPKKPSTILTDKGRIVRHIKPLMGPLKVASVDRDDIENFMHAVATGKTAGRIKTRRYGLARVTGGKGTATRTVGLLSAIFTFAVKHRMRTDNPCAGVTRYADGRRERRLAEEEYAMLGDALRRAEGEGIWPPAIAAVRFVALTGWRLGEVLDLTWEELDLARRTATLGDTKTGRSLRPLSHAACDVLRAIPRIGGHNRVFPATRGDGPMVGFKKFLPKIAKDLPRDITAHVYRHSVASVAVDLGYSELAIAGLLGHRLGSVTSRYAHAADAVLLAAADRVADRILEMMGEAQPSGDIVPLRA